MDLDDAIKTMFLQQCVTVRKSSEKEFMIKSGLIKEIVNAPVCTLCNHYIPIMSKEYCCGDGFSVVSEADYLARFPGGGDLYHM